ncbi:MAG TPA: sigma-70 family RNA polymerase sigma factor [Candidatus Sulfopaludibacter sp.]|nr:sigma-70 family RNA polymerase sigma factor [Candidatus Sulfopaludibacter sp.]
MNMPLPSEVGPDAVSGATGDATWSPLVERIQRGDSSAMEELYRIFSTGVRFYLCRQLGPQDLEDRVHDAFLIITQSIQRGDLRDPERLMGYIRTVVRRQVAAQIETVVQSRRNCAPVDIGLNLQDRHPNPEVTVIERQNTEVAMRVLQSIPARDREVLIRFYLKEQRPEQICREMELTETQFRLIKSRAKARFGELGRRRFSRRSGFRSIR